MRKIQYPCNACAKGVCDYRRCKAYRRWLNGAWQQFGRYENRPYWASSPDQEEKLLYVHPEVFRKYLQDGPCGRCACSDFCDSPCRHYWLWWDARMIWMKRKLQDIPKENPSRSGGVFQETNSARRAMKSLFLGHSEVSEKYSLQTSSSRLA